MSKAGGIAPDVALDVLRAARLAAQDASSILDMGIEFDDSTAISEGVDILAGVMSDTVHILQHAGREVGLGSSRRRGTRPWMPEEMVDVLRTAIAIDQIAMEGILKTRMDLSVEQEELLMREFYRLLHAIKVRAVTTRRVIEERWPGFWGAEHDAEFLKYLPRSAR